MWERIVVSVVASLIVMGIPLLYQLCQKNKEDREAEGKVYYGLFRMILLYISAVISSEMLLIIIFGTETIEGMEALIMTLIGSLPFMCIYVLVYRYYQKKKINRINKNVY